MKKPYCSIDGKEYPSSQLMSMELVRESIFELIKKDFPEIKREDYICLDQLNFYRSRYIEDVLEAEKGELNQLDQAVIQSLEESQNISKNLNDVFAKDLTFGQRVADKIAEFGGSWSFITIFLSIIVVWMIVNTFILLSKAFDPYPFILLNLVLSCLAALQAPIIMMSQNRISAKDRMRDEQDYMTNLKAEIEIRHLHEKLDHFLLKEWQRLLEIQSIQTELIEELSGHGLISQEKYGQLKENQP